MFGRDGGGRKEIGWGLLCLAGFAVWLFFLLGGEAQRAWRALLVNFIFFTPLAAGLVVWSAIVLASRGSWHGRLERFNLAGCFFAVPSVLLLAALAFGSPEWLPFYGEILHQGVWLDAPFLFGRDLAALILFWVMALWYRRRRGRGEGSVSAPLLVLVYCLVFTLLGYDLVMALDPHWYSALFGGYFFISGLYIAAAAWTLLSVLQRAPETKRLHDLGKLVFAFSILTTYMMYSQLLPIWYENIPKETIFLIPRMNFQPWKSLSLLLLAVVWLGPVVLLLSIRAKRSRWYLGAVVSLILAGMWVERYWLVAPSFHEPLPLGIVELALAAALAGLFGAGMSYSLRRAPEGPLPVTGEEG